MIEYIQAGYFPIDFEGLMDEQRHSNGTLRLYEHDKDANTGVPNAYFLNTVASDGQRLICVLYTGVPEHAAAIAFIEDLKLIGGVLNRPIIPGEVRFKTHNLAMPSDWDGRTTGDPTAWVMGGLFWNNDAGAWYKADMTPVDWIMHYDDVHYRWVDNIANSLAHDPQNPAYDPVTQPYTIHAWLDQATKVNGCPVWKDGAGNIIVQFDPTFVRTITLQDGTSATETGAWVRKDDLGNWTIDVTSSRWICVPYHKSKIEMLKAVLYAESGAIVPDSGSIHYRAYGYYPLAGQVVKFTDWEYPSMERFEEGSDESYTSPVVLAGHTNPLKIIKYDYTRMPQVLDDLSKARFAEGHAWRLDIASDNHRPVKQTATAKATFIARKLKTL